MTRYELLKTIHPLLDQALVVSNIGIPSQELYALGDRPHCFYMLGSMGLCSSIGLGLAMSVAAPVVALDGDGSVLMNLGTLATLARNAPDNYTLVIIDNGSYGSTGDQPTFTSQTTSLAAMARGAGVKRVVECPGEALAGHLEAAMAAPEMTVIVARVEPGNAQVAPIPLHPLVIRERFRAVIPTIQERQHG